MNTPAPAYTTEPPPPAPTVLGDLVRRAIAWTAFYGTFAAVIVISDHLVPNVLYLNL